MWRCTRSRNAARLARVLRRHIREFEPDWVLVSSEDLGHALLREAHFSAPGRVVYLAHTPQFFPFGPASWNPDPAAAELVARAAGVVAIGHHTAAYIERHIGPRAMAEVRDSSADLRQRPVSESGLVFDTGLVTMVNPCAVKGISIFLALAERFPAYGFGCAARLGHHRRRTARQLAAHANIAMLPNCRHIAEFLGRTRVLLMPSLWYEGFGLTVMEAMLHGIPVIASDAGGLVEAKMGTPFVAHAPAIERYAPVFDEHALPQPVIGPVDLEPWEDALRALLTDRALYERVSAASREAALALRRRPGCRAHAGIICSRSSRAKPCLSVPRWPACRPRNAPAVADGSRPEALNAHPAGAERALLSGVRRRRPFQPAMLMEALAARGHTCRVVARIAALALAGTRNIFANWPRARSRRSSREGGVVVFRRAGVEAHVVTHHPNLRAYFAAQIAAFAPDVDPDFHRRSRATAAGSFRAGGCAHGLPGARHAGAAVRPGLRLPKRGQNGGAAAGRRGGGVSRYVADYIRQWSGIPAVHVPISLLDPPPYPGSGPLRKRIRHAGESVRGEGHFHLSGSRGPHARRGSLLAVPTWGTDQADRAALARRPNVTVIDPVDNVDEILRRTRVLLVPSLWAEARSRIVVEAMLRGVPVLAGDIGGIREAKLGVDYLLPVRPIEKYQPRLDEQMVPWRMCRRRISGHGTRRSTPCSRIARITRRFRGPPAKRRWHTLRSSNVGPFETLLEQTLQQAAGKPVSAHAAHARKRRPNPRSTGFRPTGVSCCPCACAKCREPGSPAPMAYRLARCACSAFRMPAAGLPRSTAGRTASLDR